MLTIVISVAFGVGMGILSALRQETWIDYIGRVVAIMALAMPYFWLAIWPGVALSAAVFGFNMFGDALRDLLDPRLRGGR